MTMFSLAELMDTKKDYQKACLGICRAVCRHGRDRRPLGENSLFDYYYG